MKITRLNKVSDFTTWGWQNLKFTEVFRNEFINISIDVYGVGVKTPMTYKKRPGGSCKIIIPFMGKLKINTRPKGKKIQTQTVDPKKEGLTLIIIGPEEEKQFENIGKIPAKVLAFYAPPFQMKEVDHLRKRFKDIPGK